MTSIAYEALAGSVESSAPSGATLYALWRSNGGTTAVVLRALMSQLTMGAIVLLFYTLAVAVDYPTLRTHLAHPLCPPTPITRSTTINTATLFQQDCWGDRPIDMGRPASGGVIAVLCVIGVTMVWELALQCMACRRLRGAERWWADRRLPVIREIEWVDVEAIMEPHVDSMATFRSAVTRRSDMFVRVYNDIYLPFVPRCLNSALDGTLLLHRCTGLPTRTCCTVVGVLWIAALPTLVVDILCRYVFRHGDALRGGGTSIGNVVLHRQWSNRALWAMRRAGEVTHVFERRMRLAASEAKPIIGAMPLPSMLYVAGVGVMVIGGAFVATVFALVMVMDEQLLTANLTAHRTVAFYVGVVGVVLAMAAPLAAKPLPIDVVHQLSKLREIAPELTLNAATFEEQCTCVVTGMEYWIVEFALELISLVTIVPWVLFVIPTQVFAESTHPRRTHHHHHHHHHDEGQEAESGGGGGGGNNLRQQLLLERRLSDLQCADGV